jgi:fructose-1,6-bisphosphatase/inositol monophosphatase family enzyme
MGAQAEHLDLRPNGCQELSQAIIACSGLPPKHGGWDQYRAYGAVALDRCGVAAGTFDGYVDVDRDHGVWDYLGAMLICRESGVAVVDAMGRDLVTLDPTERRGPVAACTAELLEQLLAMQAAW